MPFSAWTRCTRVLRSGTALCSTLYAQHFVLFIIVSIIHHVLFIKLSLLSRFSRLFTIISFAKRNYVANGFLRSEPIFLTRQVPVCGELDENECQCQVGEVSRSSSTISCIWWKLVLNNHIMVWKSSYCQEINRFPIVYYYIAMSFRRSRSILLMWQNLTFRGMLDEDESYYG